MNNKSNLLSQLEAVSIGFSCAASALNIVRYSTDCAEEVTSQHLDAISCILAQLDLLNQQLDAIVDSAAEGNAA